MHIVLRILENPMSTYNHWFMRARLKTRQLLLLVALAEEGNIHRAAQVLSMPDFEKDGGAAQHFCLVYRPPQGAAFCFEPITQPIDAFHLPGQPGLRVLGPGERFSLKIHWRVESLG